MKGIRRRFFVRYLTYILVPVLVPVVMLGTLILSMINQSMQNECRTHGVERAGLIADALRNLVTQDIQHKQLLYSNTDSNSAYTVLKAVLQTNAAPFNLYQQYKIVRSNIMVDLAVKPEILYTIFFTDNPYRGYYDQGVRYLTGDEEWFSLGQTCEVGSSLYVRTKAPSGSAALLVLHRIDPHSFWAVWYDYNALLQAMSVTDLSEQSIFYVADDAGHLLFYGGGDRDIPPQTLAADGQDVVSWEGYRYAVAQADASPFHVLVLSPLPGWNELRGGMVSVFLASLFVSLLVCVGLSLLFTLREYNQLRTVLNLLEHPTKSTTERHRRLRDEYSHILDGAVAQYVHSSQLQLELSERKHQLTSAQLGALQYQINPHFILNTLQIVDFELLRKTGRHSPANDLLSSLATLLDYSLHSPVELAPLRQEIRVTEEYLHILQLHYNGRFRTIWDYSPDVLDYGTPKLLLQPLIENCVLHGLHDRTIDNPGLLVIQLRRQRSRLMIRVLDNGVGIPRRQLDQLREEIVRPTWTKRNTIGLRNIRQRMVLLFGENCDFQIHSREGRGTLFRLCIPLVPPGAPEA